MGVLRGCNQINHRKRLIPASHHGNVEAIGAGDRREGHESREQRIHVL